MDNKESLFYKSIQIVTTMILNQTVQPKIVTIKRRHNQGFGFTLRHFIAYPPESWTETLNTYQRKGMETIFIKEIHPHGPAYIAGLKTGDRILMVNNISVAGISYSTIVSMVKQTPTVLKLQVVPKECDILQMYYTDIAHNPETNRPTIDIDRPMMPITSSTNFVNNNFHSRLISYSPEGFPNLTSTVHQPNLNLQKSTYSFNCNEYFLEDASLKQENLSVLRKPNNDELLGRLRKSIEQKEEFLKSLNQNSSLSFINNVDNIARSKNKLPLELKTYRNNIVGNNFNEFNQDKNFNSNAFCTEPQSIFYGENYLKPAKSLQILSINSSINSQNTEDNGNSLNNLLKNSTEKSNELSNFERKSNDHFDEPVTYFKDILQQESELSKTLSETCVTNKVFERKLVRNLSKSGPFKQFSFNVDKIDKSTPEQKAVSEEFKKEISTMENEFFSSNDLIENERGKDISNSIGEANDEFNIATQSTMHVIRRIKNFQEDNFSIRRISYLRATKNEKADLHMDTDNFTLNTQNRKDLNKQPCIGNITLKIQNGCEFKNNKNDKYGLLANKTSPKSKLITDKNDAKAMNHNYETEMEMKSISINGKRMAEYRSWRPVKIELRGFLFKIYLIRSSKSDNSVINLDIKHFQIVDETVDKKKFIFRLQSKPLLCCKDKRKQQKQNISILNNSEVTIAHDTKEYTEILFKTKNFNDVQKLFDLFLEQERKSNENIHHTKELSETLNISICGSGNVPTPKFQAIKDNSPLPSSKSLNIKNTVLNSESVVESISPDIKLRQSFTKVFADKELSLSKSKNWKDLFFRRIYNLHSDTSSSTSITNGISKYVGSIGVPLKFCPMSKENIFVPIIVDLCTKIVERKGLQIIGIYRIPGNKAAISELKDQVNKSDFQWDSINMDIRWEDVNVVSSLLKLFIRSLPDALLPGTSYINFIEADKKCDEQRLKELCYLLKALPQYSYETMKHIVKHLNKVSMNCKVNLMEPKNLAIIFGPSIIRIPNETLDMAVKDMKHQCRIVELLISQYDYFFENGVLPETDFHQNIIATSSLDQTNLLLDNVSKIEQLCDKESLTSRFMPHFRRRTLNKRVAIGSETYSEESVLSLEYRKVPDFPLKYRNAKKISSNESTNKNRERNSVEISILSDGDSSTSRISDTGSMSLRTITDALDSKLRTLRSSSESTDISENYKQNKMPRSFPQTLVLQENIAFLDESNKSNLMPANNTISSSSKDSNGRQLNILPIFSPNLQKYILPLRNQSFSSVYESWSDDSEVSTTSDPKETESLSPFFPEWYKKRRGNRLYRSTSLNCRIYSMTGNHGFVKNTTNILTKDEKTDMNLTKKRQIQNKPTRSIKRRHTLGGPHNYSTTATSRKYSSNKNSIFEVANSKTKYKSKKI